jgi:hypothetical protein
LCCRLITYNLHAGCFIPADHSSVLPGLTATILQYRPLS